MRFLFLATCILYTISASAQTKIYFKDESLSKEVPKKKAKYLRTEFNSGDTLISQLSRLSDNFIIRQKKWIANNPIGVWYEYALNGELISKRDFRSVNYKSPLPEIYNNAKDSVSCSNCSPAIFMTGISDLYRYLAMNIDFPKESRALGSKGRVTIAFKISKEGYAKPYTILRGVDPYIDLAAWELINQMPKWNPATQEGEPIESYFILPIKYSIN